MSDNNGKVKLWVYAVVLFSSAFIVLLLTAYSQIRMNYNINDYKSIIFNTQTEKNKFKTDYNTVSKQLKSLKTEVDKLKKDLDAANNEITSLKAEKDNITEAKNNNWAAYEKLLLAEDYYDKGNIVESAKILRYGLDISLLSANGQALYNKIKAKTYQKAALLLYREGYHHYSKGQYPAAVEKFIESAGFSETEYFSDDCYYLMACSEYRSGNMENAKGYLDMLLNKYPDSNYYHDAEKLLKQLK